MISIRFELPPAEGDFAGCYRAARDWVSSCHDSGSGGKPALRLTIHVPQGTPGDLFATAAELLGVPVSPFPCGGGLAWGSHWAADENSVAFFLSGTWLFPPATGGEALPERGVEAFLARAAGIPAGCRIAVAWDGLEWKGAGDRLVRRRPIPETPLRAQAGWNGAGAYPGNAIILSNRRGLAAEKAGMELAAWCLLEWEPFGEEDPRSTGERIRAACPLPSRGALGLPSLEVSADQIVEARRLHDSASLAAYRITDLDLRERAQAKIRESQAAARKDPPPTRKPSLRTALRRGLRRGLRDLVELPPAAPEGVSLFGSAGSARPRFLLRVGTGPLGDRLEARLGLSGFDGRPWLPAVFLPSEEVLGPVPECPAEPMAALAWSEGFARAVSLVRPRFVEVIRQVLASSG